MSVQRTHLHTVLDRCKPGLVAVFILSFGVNILVLTGAVYMLQVYDRVLTSRSWATLFYLTLIAVAALLVMAALDVVRSRILVRIGLWIDRVLSPLVFARTVELGRRKPGEGAEALRDVAALRNFLGGGASITLMDAPWTPLYIAFVYLLHPYLGHVAIIGALVLFGIALATNALTHNLSLDSRARSTEAYRGASASVRNSDSVTAMGMIGSLARRWDFANAHALDLQARASDRNSALSAAAKFVRMTLQVAVLGVGAGLVIEGHIGPGVMVAASIIIGRALAPVEQAIGVWKQVMGARDSWGRLDRLFRDTAGRAAPMALPPPQGRLDVDNVTFRPPDAKEPVLANVSFSLQPGEALAIVGPSGAGKSSLARVILGLHDPLAGTVRLDGADIAKAGRNQFGRHIGFMAQSVELFPGAVSENIARMDGDADPARVVAAAQLAGVHETILRLPQGYDTQIRDNGAPLSGGQLQRVGLARAVYGDPCLVVLDEPNASLDAQGEEALNIAIEALKARGATIVIVAHRPTMMKHMDKVLVLKDGRVQMFGDRDIVLEKIQPRTIEQPRRVRIVS